ncbi:hypothetical protein [Embleya sp. NPDC005971]|uniref:hypothetical protein n=1 Tax=Embleya sp. NPDC005971 TaxID=3156724 RepID=UPI0033FC41DF
MIITTATAVDREAAWLRTSGDGLPALLAVDGGPWDVVQAYMSRTPGQRKRQLYVVRERVEQPRTSVGRMMATHHFKLKIIWPMSSGDGNAEASQRAFDAALDVVLQRVAGFLGDKTHGGRFLSAAENPPRVTIDYEPVEQALQQQAGAFFATVSYACDDPEIVG